MLDTLVRSAMERADKLPDLSGHVHEPFRKRSLAEAISSAGGRNAVIGEIKFASPSRGRICTYEDPCSIAADLVEGGCIALSVLTEPEYFCGSTETLTRVRAMDSVPVLRKDFIVDTRQLAETRAIGADAVLLIARILGDRLHEFVDRSLALGIEPLVEVHSRDELSLALSTGAGLIGINNRDLTTMEIDISTTRRLSHDARESGRLVVAESGIRCPEDIRYLKGYGDAFLIGSAIMESGDRKKTAEGFVSA
jgi:indole-3-glycerol phosphate synthase